MYEQKIRKIMQGVVNKKIDVDEAIKKMKFMPFEDLGFAKVDHHRALRKGFPEVIYCQNKTKKQVVGIAKRLAKNNSVILATRATEEMFKEVKKHIKNTQYNEKSKTIIINQNKKIIKTGKFLS